jgi:hypothetical protein
MAEQNYPAGFFYNLPREGAPSFVKGSVAIRPDVFIEWLKEQKTNDKGYVRLQFKEGRDGKGYATLDTYGLNAPRASQQATEEDSDTIDADSIPF